MLTDNNTSQYIVLMPFSLVIQTFYSGDPCTSNSVGCCAQPEITKLPAVHLHTRYESMQILWRILEEVPCTSCNANSQAVTASIQNNYAIGGKEVNRLLSKSFQKLLLEWSSQALTWLHAKNRLWTTDSQPDETGVPMVVHTGDAHLPGNLLWETTSILLEAGRQWQGGSNETKLCVEWLLQAV